MGLYSMYGVAGEDLYTSRVVYSTATAEGSVAFLMADSINVEPKGVTQEGSQRAPTGDATEAGIAAYSGTGVDVRGRGHQMPVKVGAVAVTAGARVRVLGSDGVIGPLLGSESGGQWTLGTAMNDADAGAVALVFIDPLPIARPVS